MTTIAIITVVIIIITTEIIKIIFVEVAESGVEVAANNRATIVGDK